MIQETGPNPVAGAGPVRHTASMSDLEIVLIDPLDQLTVDQLLGVLQAAQDADSPDFPKHTPAPAIVGLVRRTTAIHKEWWLARRAGRVVGAAEIDLPQRDNRHLAEVELNVAPDERRQGIGTALLRHIEQRIADSGRDTVITYVVDPIEGGPARPVHGQRFAEAFGYARGLDEIHRVADLAAVPERQLDQLLADAWRHADGYELVQWAGSQPDEIVDGVAYLNGRMNLDAPIGELPLEQQDIDAARMRESEAMSHASGMLRLGTVVRHRVSGEVAGLTDIHVVPGDEEHCWQGNTIVDPRHRGRRLGTVLKIENHRHLMRYRPRMRYVHTWNAEVNAHMIAINEAVGYRAVDRWIAYQKKLSADG
jgi:GNAT superfamily N-acetyltransferase